MHRLIKLIFLLLCACIIGIACPIPTDSSTHPVVVVSRVLTAFFAGWGSASLFNSMWSED